MDKLIFMLIVVSLSIVVLSTRRVNYRRNKSNVLVVIYETDLSNSHLQHLKESLKKNFYNYVILTDKKWNGFGAKIRKIQEYLRKLDPNQLVIVSDARDVLSVNFNSAQLVAAVREKVEIESKVIVSTEIGCCVPAKHKPGDLRTTTGKVLKRTYDKGEGENKDSLWKRMFSLRAKSKNVKHPIEHKQSIYLNAGIYCGKAKNIVGIYKLMNIVDKEDDQLIMSEIFYHYPNKFHLDYNREFFSNSHVWDSFNNKPIKDDTGCFYEKDSEGKIRDTYIDSTPFFVHTPGKHFKCYDHVKMMMTR